MSYSNLYKKYYPFKSPSDLLSLNEEERAILIKYIRSYPPRSVNLIHRAWKNGRKVEGYPRPKGTFVSRNKALGDIAVELREMCEELIDKINKEELVTDKDLDNINCILYSNKPLLKWLLS